MKKLLLFISIVISLSAKAQTSIYHPFPESNAVWNGSYDHGLILCSEYYSYVINGDTTIGSFLYHKLFISSLQVNGGCPTVHSAGYNGCYRQDTLARKIFYVAPGNSTEDLLYNFNLQVGDTIYGFNRLGCTFMTDTITQIDSILIGGNYRKRWTVGTHMPPGHCQNQIIEGIGFVSGLLEACGQCMPDIRYFSLICFSQDGITLYPNSTTNCEVLTSTQNISGNISEFTILPNPLHATTLLQVSAEFENAELKIYNPLGQQIKRQRIINKSAIINRDGLPDGIYFFKITNDKEQVITGKFIIE